MDLSAASTSELVEELRIRREAQADPAKVKKPEEVSTQQAALELGVSVATLRSWMKHKHVNIGIYDKKDGKSKADIHIYRNQLDAEKKHRMLV